MRRSSQETGAKNPHDAADVRPNATLRATALSEDVTVLNSANGTLQVNIRTPSAAGVSRNAYSQFDIDRSGVILNNSRVDTST